MKNRVSPLLPSIALVFVVATSSRGGLIGGNFVISGAGCRFPDVAYNNVNGNYLVTWMDYNYAPPIVFGRLVTNGGAVSGSVFQISDGTGGFFPAVCHNATNNEFLVAWSDQRPGILVYGQRIRGSDGALLGGNFPAGTVTGAYEAVAWSPVSNNYLVAFASGTEVYGQRVSSTGGLMGSSVNLSNDTQYSGNPAVSWGSNGNQYLVTWDNDNDLHGQRVDAATGALLGGRLTIGGVGVDDRSCIAYDGINGRWLVQFNLNGIPGDSYDQYGQFITPSGSLSGGQIPIAATAGFEGDTLFGGDIAFAPGAARYFASFVTDTGMGGQELHASGAPVAPQVVLASNGGSGNNAADSNLNRFLSVWEGPVNTWLINGQLFEATSNPPPGPVANLTVSSGNSQNTLTWTNPVETFFTGTLIRYRTDTYPTSPTEGTLVIEKAGTPGANDSYTHTGLVNGTAYYYSVWSHNATPVYNLVTQHGHATPTPPQCFSDSFAYANGNLNGNGGWSGSAASEIQVVGQTVRINGGATSVDSAHAVTCGDPGTGYIQVSVKVQSGSGTTTMWSLWYNDPGGINMCRWYGTGTSARGRIGASTTVTAAQTLTGGWDNLVVRINPIAKSTEFFFNGLSIGVLDYSTQGADNVVGNLRFERSTSTAGDYLSFDDLVVGATAVLPGNATNPNPANGATAVDRHTDLSWAAAGGATSHDVRFGTANPPPLATNQTSSTYDPGTLAIDTTYYWRIDEKNGSGTTIGQLWMFTTGSYPGDFDYDGDGDQSDFSHLQICFSGNTFSFVAGCSSADLDGDGDVDSADFSLFLNCMAGPDHASGC